MANLLVSLRTKPIDRTRLLTERFGRAAEQIGHDEPAVRLAGVYAMAALADEWEEQRQQCADVLCGYMRLFPWEQNGEEQVRNTIVHVIWQHLISTAPISWSPLDFNFTGATFLGDHSSFVGATFTGVTTFDRATFTGVTTFDRATFTRRTSFDGAKFGTFRRGQASFARVKFACGASFEGATFTGCAVFDGARFTDVVSFRAAKFTDGAVFSEAEFSVRAFVAGRFVEGVVFNDAEFTADTSFVGARFNSASFEGARTKRPIDLTPAFIPAEDMKVMSAVERYITLPDGMQVTWLREIPANWDGDESSG